MADKLRLRRGDTVVVLTGREKGKRGKIMRVDRSERRVVVQGVNIVKRHTRPSAAQPGGIVEKEAALHLSNVALADPKSGEPTRIGFRWLTDGRKVRYAKKSGEVIDA